MSDIRFELVYTASVNFALQQNHVPVVKSLVVHNDGLGDICDAALEIGAEPVFFAPFSKLLPALPAGQAVDAGPIDLKVSPEYLANLTERVSGLMKVGLLKGGEPLLSETYSLDLLAFDAWSGLNAMPESIAAFVTPNHAGLAPLIKQASELVGKWTGNPSLDGYQSNDANRARLQAAAAYAVLQGLAVAYAEPPASFEAAGQRIRMCATVLDTRMGTCIDTSLFYASVLEAMGLHPLIVFTKGHTFASVWLENECFPEAVQDDGSAIRKRTAPGVNGICIVETTAATAGRSVPFEEAEKLALGSLSAEDAFVLAVDVKRARAASIRPLPERVRGDDGWVVVPESAAATATLPGQLDAAAQMPAGHAPYTKQQQWERRLLDLSLRNTLVNLRMTKNVLQILTASLSGLEDALSSGDEFQVLEKPQDWQHDGQDGRMPGQAGQADPLKDLLKFEFEKKRLRTPLASAELGAAMTGLYRSARVSLEENGANTLYLTLGLLKWYETPASQKPRLAPLVLLPIEIIRKSAVKGYVIRLRDDEPQMNITLLEMLKQDFGLTIGGLDPLPADERGVDIRRVFSVMRQAVMPRSQWDVLEDAYIGIFSFSQFVMWNDMRNRARELASSRVVSSLIAGKLTWQPAPIGAGCGELDSACSPGRVFVPITADASQLEAVIASGEGKSFVLHGPPGTGKSQTITNMIANALACGKTVLFVAEKMAALSVVQRRLEAVGIGPFCLELHSNKSKKKDVLEQLRAATEAVRAQSPQEFAAQAERLAVQRQELNAYVDALHHAYPFGLTLYEAISGYGGAGASQEIECRQDEFQTLTRAELDRRAEVCESLAAAAKNTGHPYENPLCGIGLIQYSQGTRAAAGNALGGLAASIGGARAKLTVLSAALGLASEPQAAGALAAFSSACAAAGKLTGAPAPLVGHADLQAVLPQLTELSAHGQAMSAARKAVLAAYREDMLGLNGGMLLDEWQRASMKWFLPKMLGQNSVAKVLQPYCPAGKVNKALAEGHLRQLAAFQSEQKKVEALLPALLPLLGGWWQEHNTNWETLKTVCALLSELDAALAKAVPSPAAARKTIAEKPELAGFLRDFALAWQEFEAGRAALAQLLTIDFARYAGAADYMETLRGIVAAWQNDLDGLREWAAWNKARSEAFSCGLAPVVSAYEKGMAHEDVLPAYLKGRYHAAAEWIIAQSPVLRDFSGAVFEDRVRQFKKTDSLFEQLTRQEIYARLAARIPNFTVEASQNSELGILQRAIRSGGRGQSIRKLFESIPNLLPRLAPCMLMSPISVAQYLDPGHPPFDLVVFDEASQLPTCKAVGTIARGRDVIVVGDPKQLPPTSFFAVNTADEEDYEIEDLESILDDCLALSMPQSSLLWHYRSRHESLIAFSNSNYYENKLLTFPSPRDLVSSVRHVDVPGSYDRGRTKQNRAEAEAVVGEIMRRLSDEALRKKSIGVVTFSSVQRNLVDDLLTAEFVKRPDLEEFATQGVEPLFIKNLENVQGDERDVILFSVGYGPDRDGKVTLNFGPLNRDGGWRRLNVAVSRAREEMVVYSTLKPDQLDAARTAARGVAGLKAFLEYAQSGKRVIPAAQANELRGKAGVERQIASALAAEGYLVNTNIGCSGYRISAAVVHPDKPGEYILGILCDGEIYRQARTARDRDLAQEAVLKQLGWNIRRVWAPDWWDNPAKETKKLASIVRELLSNDGGPGKPGEPAGEQKSAPAASARPAAQTFEAKLAAKQYVPVKLPQETMPPDDFTLPQNANRIARKIALAVNGEGPISYSLLCYRVLQSFGVSRMGARIERTIQQLLARFAFATTTQEGSVFYWPAGMQPDTCDSFRVCDSEDSRRDAEDLPAEEIAVAVREVLRQQIGLPAADLAREAAKLMGYARLGPAVEQAMKLGIGLAVRRGWAEDDGKGNIR